MGLGFRVYGWAIPKGPCTQAAYTLAPKYLGDYFKAKVYAIWVHGPFGYVDQSLSRAPKICSRRPWFVVPVVV